MLNTKTNTFWGDAVWSLKIIANLFFFLLDTFLEVSGKYLLTTNISWIDLAQNKWELYVKKVQGKVTSTAQNCFDRKIVFWIVYSF